MILYLQSTSIDTYAIIGFFMCIVKSGQLIFYPNYYIILISIFRRRY
jgi:hypothetical protein